MRTDRHKTARSALLGATALGCSLIVMGAAAPAFAANECGAPVAGVVTCTGTHGAVNYATPTDTAFVVEDGAELGPVFAQGAGDVDVLIEDGATVDSFRVLSTGDISITNDATSGVGSISAGGPAGDITIDSVAVSALVSGISASGDNVAIRSGSVVSTQIGASTAGIQVTFADTLTIVSDNIQSGAMGIQARVPGIPGLIRTANITSGSITSGTAGIAVSASEAVTVQSGSIQSGSDGIAILAGGLVTIVSDEIETTGDGSAGIVVNGGGSKNIKSNSIVTTGDGAHGIDVAAGAGSTTVIDGGDITTSGQNAYGVRYSAGAVASSVDVKAGVVKTTGDGSYGVLIDATSASATFDVESIETAGISAHGLVVSNDGGDVSGRIGSVATEGRQAHGVNLYGTTVTVDSGVVSTEGTEAFGILAGSEGGLLTLDSDSVSTGGEGAIGMNLSSTTGIVLRSGSVTTTGLKAIGIDAYVGDELPTLAPGARTMDITAQTVSTAGEGATGIRAVGEKIIIDAGTVTTTGGAASGLEVTASDEVGIKAANIETSGLESHGVYLKTLSDGLDAIVDVGTIKTHGDEADGIYVSDDGGDAKINVSADSVTTNGFDADGVAISFGDDVTLDLGAVKTTGASSNGVRLGGTDGDFRMKLASVLTEGEGSYGVMMESNFATYDVDIGTATTTGRGAAAISTNSTEVEAVKVKAGTVTTSGEGSRGLNLRADLITLDIGAVKTTGADAAGIVMRATNTGNPGRLTMTGEVDSIETTGAGSAGMTIQTTGNVDLDIGAVTTRGANSAGLSGTATGGGVLNIGTVLTEGANSAGVVMSANTGGFSLNIDGLETRGADSTGVLLTSKAASAVDASVVRTRGDRSTAIQATVTAGDLVVTADDVRTTGNSADGVVASASGAATLNLGYVDVTGSEADAVTATAGGALKLTASRRLGSASGVAASLTGATIDLAVASTGVVAGGSAGLVLNAQTTSTVTNAGVISSASGLAIEGQSGAATINNSGTIRGRVGFASGADTFNNSGRFEVAGVNDFGGGSDVFNNAANGIVTFATSTTPLSASFTNLETFNNAGLIDLANGVAGDVLSISGTLNSTAGSRIQLDVNLGGATPVADRINVGAIAGTSVLQLQMQGQGQLGETGVTLVDSAAGQTGQEFTVQTIDGGFLDYDLAYDAATSSYQLVGELAVQAFEPTKVASGAQTQWRKGADVVTARLADLRDGHALTGPNRGQVWAQGFGGEESLDGRNNLSGTGGDLSLDVTAHGFQIGADIEQAFAGGQATIGGVIGAGRTKLTFDGNGDRSEFESTSVGVYGQWTQGPLTIGGLVKGEFHDLTYDWASADLSDEADGETWGAMLNVSARLPLAGAWFAEPDAGVTWNTTDLDGISDAAGTVTFGDTESLIGRFGLRAGSTIRTASGAVVQPYAGLHVNREFDGDNRSILTLGAVETEVADEGRRTWAEASMGVNVQGKAGLGGFAQVEALGGDIEGYGVRIGARFSW